MYLRNGCAKTAANTSIQVDCDNIRVWTCADDSCSNECIEITGYDAKYHKRCEIETIRYSKSFCSSSSSPFPDDPQFQTRTYSSIGPNNTCESNVEQIIGYPTNQCVGLFVLTSYGVVTCNGSKPSVFSCTDSSCNACSSVLTPPTCDNGSQKGCGVISVAAENAAEPTSVPTSESAPLNVTIPVPKASGANMISVRATLGGVFLSLIVASLFVY
jgi:hypothetical protein